VHGCNLTPVSETEVEGFDSGKWAYQKKQAAQGEASSGLVGEVLRGGGLNLFSSSRWHYAVFDYMDDGFVVWPVVGAAGVVSPTVLVMRRTSTRRLSARPEAVLFDSTGLSLPRPIT